MSDIIIVEETGDTVVVQEYGAVDTVTLVATGPQGPQGPQGPTGATGATGAGVPVGGTTGQVLAKTSATNYATAWVSPAAGTVTSVAATVPSFLSVTGSPVTTSGTLAIGYSGVALPLANGGTGATSASTARTNIGAYAASNPNGYTSNTGTVTSVAATVPVGLAVAGTPITTAGTLAITYAAGYSIPATASQTNWDTAYTDRLKWDGGSTGLVAATGRTSLGLGTMATQASSAVSITGGSVTNITDLAIADGGTGASTATAAFDALAPTTTKGDLIVDDGTNNVRLPVGANTYVLVADSTQATGVKWAAPSSGSAVAIADEGTTLTSAVSSINFTGTGVTATNVGSAVTVAITSGGGSGDVVGPASATDNAITRFDLTTGKLIQNSTVTLDDTGNVINANSVGFDTTPGTLPTSVGTMSWDDGDGVPSVILKGGNATLQVGTQEYARVYNESGATLTLGQVVYISGAQGNRVAVRLARANVEATSFGTIGLVTESIANGAEGFILVSGALYKLNTSAFTAGAAVYLSPTTAGAITTTKPQAPDQLVVLGWVERVDATVGSIYVKIDNGYELDELHDVQVSSPASGNLLIYDASTSPTGVWKNANLTAGTGVSVTGGAGSITVANTGVLSLTGTTNEIDVSASTGAISLSLPATINANTTGSAATLTTGRTIAITGDLVYTSPSFDGSANVTAAGTLATVNSNVGSFTNANVTVNAKGLITAVSSGTTAGTNWVSKTANYTAVNGDKLLADTSGGTFTITLPASPSTGHSVEIADGAAWGTINLTIARNASTIEGLAEDLTLDVSGIQIELVYNGVTWEVYAVATSVNTNIGYKNIPAVGTKTASYTLTTADVGKYVQVSTGGSVTIPDAVFSEGDVISIFNNTASAITITCNITTAYISGSDTDRSSMSLGTRGTATVLFISGTTCVLTGTLS